MATLVVARRFCVGCRAPVCADADGASAERAAQALCRFFRARRDAFLIALPAPEEALRVALDLGMPRFRNVPPERSPSAHLSPYGA